jgi:hypothetical protein
MESIQYPTTRIISIGERKFWVEEFDEEINYGIYQLGQNDIDN